MLTWQQIFLSRYQDWDIDMLVPWTTVLCLFLACSMGSALENVSKDDQAVLKDTCGSKLAAKLVEYAKFHAEVLSQKQPQRYLVSVPVEAGLADRMTGLISHFWLAFFSKRAFQLGSYDRLPSFEYAYDYRFINWTRPPDPSEYTRNLLFTYKGSRGYEGDRSYNSSLVNTEEYFPDYLINNYTRTKEIFQFMNLIDYPDKSKAFPVKHTVFTSSNRGGIRYMFENNHMKKTLKELEMDKQTAFRCAYNFLFEYNSETNHIAEPFLQSMKRHTDINSSLIIGIGIRAGDESFNPRKDGHYSSSVFSGVVGCAARVEQTYYDQHPSKKEMGMNLPWYVIADSLHVRKLIAARFKHKVVIDSETTYFHGDCGDKPHGGCDQSHLKQAIIHAASQLKLFSMCNVHIVFFSGFPRVGAFLSKPPYHIYNDHGDCAFSKRENIDYIMDMGAGFRI